ncbi:hypothetical protein C0T31_07260 [Dysgonamonadaceae bacterium]|nr:hypothetical protein C0T31_07260 [Dysgonamonadaceae bacterium]
MVIYKFVKKMIKNTKIKICLTSMFLLFSLFSSAGPPFNTDDPAPIDYKHWEFYVASINTLQSHNRSGTSPHFEMNYGVVPNMQLHLLLPLNYSYTKGEGVTFGYSNTEAGVKYRFLQETEHRPQIGIFPIVEIPTIHNDAFGNGKAQIYLPVWIQKSWDKLTTYGGGGYWINTGKGNKDWIFSGWEVQYDFSKHFTLGGEVYYQNANSPDSQSALGFNIGGFINFSDQFHFIYSLGHSMIHENYFSTYVGLLVTI